MQILKIKIIGVLFCIVTSILLTGEYLFSEAKMCIVSSSATNCSGASSDVKVGFKGQSPKVAVIVEPNGSKISAVDFNAEFDSKLGTPSCKTLIGLGEAKATECLGSVSSDGKTFTVTGNVIGGDALCMLSNWEGAALKVAECEFPVQNEPGSYSFKLLVYGADGTTAVLDDGGNFIVGSGAGSFPNNPANLVVEDKPPAQFCNTPTLKTLTSTYIPASDNATVKLTWDHPTKWTDDAGGCSASQKDIVPSSHVEKTIIYFNSETIEVSGTTNTYDHTGRTVGTQICYQVETVGKGDLAGIKSNKSSQQCITPQKGKAPTITSVTIPESAVQNSEVTITGTVSDEDSTPLDQKITLTLYYWDCSGLNLGKDQCTIDNGKKTPISVKPEASGKFTFKIPGKAVLADQDLIFGIVAVDEMTLTTTYPSNFDPDNPTSANTSQLPGDKIIAGKYFTWLPDKWPFPSQFPFNAGHGIENSLKIDFALNDKSSVYARIYSLDGKLVRILSSIKPDDTSVNDFDDLCSNVIRGCGECKYNVGCKWDGTDYTNVNYVPDGMYIITITAFSEGNFKGQYLEYTKGIVVIK